MRPFLPLLAILPALLGTLSCGSSGQTAYASGITLAAIPKGSAPGCEGSYTVGALIPDVADTIEPVTGNQVRFDESGGGDTNVDRVRISGFTSNERAILIEIAAADGFVDKVTPALTSVDLSDPATVIVIVCGETASGTAVGGVPVFKDPVIITAVGSVLKSPESTTSFTLESAAVAALTPLYRTSGAPAVMLQQMDAVTGPAFTDTNDTTTVLESVMVTLSGVLAFEDDELPTLLLP